VLRRRRPDGSLRCAGQLAYRCAVALDISDERMSWLEACSFATSARTKCRDGCNAPFFTSVRNGWIPALKQVIAWAILCFPKVLLGRFERDYFVCAGKEFCRLVGTTGNPAENHSAEFLFFSSASMAVTRHNSATPRHRALVARGNQYG
jgi:hypothetical protein